MNQSEFAEKLAEHLWQETCRMGTTEQRYNLLIVQWLLDNDIRFHQVKVDHHSDKQEHHVHPGQQVCQADT